MQDPPFVYDSNNSLFGPEYPSVPPSRRNSMGDCNYLQNHASLDRNISKIIPDSLLAKLAVPCQTVSDDYDYGLCYSYYANGSYNTCQFVEVGDIEDFM